MNSDLWAKICEVNRTLEVSEPGNVQTETHAGREFTGYLPQAVIDAVNENIGPENWAYTVEVISTSTNQKSVQACVKVTLTIMGVSREAFGGGISPSSPGDALKGATTDALKKALGAFSIGNRAFLGLLEKGGKRNGNGDKETQLSPSLAVQPATEKQLRLLAALHNTLAANPALRTQPEVKAALDEIKKRWPYAKEDTYTREQASAMIDILIKAGVEPTYKDKEV